MIINIVVKLHSMTTKNVLAFKFAQLRKKLLMCAKWDEMMNCNR